jgi:hypothetical protein
VEPKQDTPARGRARVRSASAKDVEAAAALVKRYWAAAKEREVRVLATEELRWLSRAARQGGGLNVISIAGVVRGVVGWRRDLMDPTRGRILVLCVEPGDWEAGAFEALLESAAQALGRAGCQAADLWLDAEGSPARFAAESLGFEVSEDRTRPLCVLGEGEEAQTLEGVRYARSLSSLSFASELIRLSWPRFLLVLLLVIPFVLLLLGEATDLLPLTGLAIPLGVVAPSAAEVWARRRNRPGAVFGLSCTFFAAGLGIAWALHVAALEGGGPSSLVKTNELFNPGIWLLGAHWAPVWLVAGLLGARSLQSGPQRSEAFLTGSVALFLSLLLLLVPMTPSGEGMAVLFGVGFCTIPSAWTLGGFAAFVFWFADDRRDRWGQSLELALG